MGNPGLWGIGLDGYEVCGIRAWQGPSCLASACHPCGQVYDSLMKENQAVRAL